MSTLDFDMNFEDGQQNEADKRLMVRFSLIPTHCEFESIQAGRPIYKDEEMIEIIIPGTRDVTAGLVTDEYRRRFPRQYAAFKQGREHQESGTPLAALVWMTPSQIAELKAVNCHTVEQLAGMPDNLAQKFMGAQSMKQRAQAYLDSARDAAPMLKLQAELEKRDEQLAQMQAQIDAMLEAQKKVPVKA